MLDKRDALLVKLAKALGLVDDAGLARVAQLRSRAPDRSIDQLLVDAGIIDKARRALLVKAFNEKVRELRSGRAPAPSARPAAPPRPASRRAGMADRGIEDSGVIGLESSHTTLPPSARSPGRGEDDLAGAFDAPPVTPDAIDRAAQASSRFAAHGDDLDLKPEGAPIRNAGSDVQHVADPPRPPSTRAPVRTASGSGSGIDGDGDDLAVPDEDEDRLLAEPTMILQDEAPGRTEEELLAEPTIILQDEKKTEEELLAEPTIVLEGEQKTEDQLLAEPTIVLDEANEKKSGALDDELPDESLLLKSSNSVKRDARPMPGIKSKKGGALDREEFKRRLKLRLGFEGTTIGDYEVLSEISRGAFGVVLKARPGGMAKTLARERGFEGDVAMKVMLETKDPEETRRFMDEVKILIQLQHPNIIKIFDAGAESGLIFYTMELVNGIDSRSLVREAIPPLLLSVRLAKDLASALATVHAQTVYHRDMKPANVLIDRSCQPFRTVLIDFGLVQKKGKDEGLVMGTPSYMPPEQAKPSGGFGEVNATSDIYSLGATFYFLLTGKPPFPGSDAKKIIKAVLSEAPPDPVTLNPTIPRRIADICMKCLNKNQRDRYVSARLLEKDLDAELKAAQLKLKAKSVWGKLFGSGGAQKT